MISQQHSFNRNIDCFESYQNKSENNKKSIISHLEKSGNEGAKVIAEEMKKI